MSYYKTAFEKLIEAKVPRWYIRLYLLGEIIYSSRVYVYYNPYNVETESGWFATNSTPADRNRKCYGELKSMGFPSWNEYAILFVGDEYDHPHEFMDAYDEHHEEWLSEREKECGINYAD